MSEPVTRRRFLALGAAGLGAVITGCSDAGSTDTESTVTASTTVTLAATTRDARSGGLTAADFADVAVCRLTREQAEGPFYLPADLLRRDITEGREGLRLRLGLQVVDGDCAPVPGALVDVWHADHTGDYSAFVDGSPGADEGPGSTFLRGSQAAGDDGVVEFSTLYPGWYPGRTVHIHVKVYVGGRDLWTSQIYFDDRLTDDVHALAPYSQRGRRTTRNGQDRIAGDVAAAGLLLHAERQGAALGDGLLGRLVLGVPA